MHAYHITNLYVSNVWLYKPCTAVHAKQTIIYKVLLVVVKTAVSPKGDSFLVKCKIPSFCDLNTCSIK